MRWFIAVAVLLGLAGCASPPLAPAGMLTEAQARDLIFNRILDPTVPVVTSDFGLMTFNGASRKYLGGPSPMIESGVDLDRELVYAADVILQADGTHTREVTHFITADTGQTVYSRYGRLVGPPTDKT